MAIELPVRIAFTLPDGWQAAPPDEVGAPEVAFVAVRPASSGRGTGGFVTNLTIAGETRDPAVRMATIADESVQRVENVAESVRVRDRADFGPGVTQVLDIELDEGKRLVQRQVYLPIDDVHDQRTVLELVLTCTPDQFDDAASDFRRFVGTVRPAR
ncbi:hypothetical protein VA596_15215 [Amycolatopsis sp., V23-08]|uniref:DUF1795 domain-containing protein n=1 Tax=Amycolatopsis heterodermiae TaxID=3110235 RepID=A0ABU5R3W2_9PSEU|nr:hypothetical protein [Amycolatopsis sp., V23-08]MEA5360896.1 hypothetical protein [Amycolatopsis sp., V23-08]